MTALCKQQNCFRIAEKYFFPPFFCYQITIYIHAMIIELYEKHSKVNMMEPLGGSTMDLSQSQKPTSKRGPNGFRITQSGKKKKRLGYEQV